jgi:hypothetical protein
MTGRQTMKITMEWREEDYKGHTSSTYTKSFTIRDWYQGCLEAMLTHLSKEEWNGKREE